jgi:hypothetical protein
MKCTSEDHFMRKLSIQTLALSVVGERLKVWPDRPEPGYVIVSGECKHCFSTLGMDIADEHWQAFSGQPVPSWVQAFEDEAVA